MSDDEGDDVMMSVMRRLREREDDVAIFLTSLADLVDLGLEVIDDLWRDVVSEDLEEVDPLVTRDALVGGEFDPFLHLLDGGALGYEVGVLRLPDGLIGEEGPLLGAAPLAAALDRRLREGMAHRHHHSESQQQFHLKKNQPSAFI